MTDVDLNNPAHPGHSDYLISCEGKQAEQIFHHPTPLHESTIGILLGHYDRWRTEHCGFIDDDNDIHEIDNVHHYPRSNFYFDEDQAQKCIDHIYEGLQRNIIGVWHTHPNDYPWPTPRDIRGWPNPKLGWRYFLVTRGIVTEWRLI